MASESLSREVDLFFAQEFFFFKQEHGYPRGSDPAKTDVILTTVLGPLRYTCYSLLGMMAECLCECAPQYANGAGPQVEFVILTSKDNGATDTVVA